MRAGILLVLSVGCMPLSNSHLGIDALGPQENHVRLSGGVGTLVDSGGEADPPTIVGGQVEVAAGARTSVFLSGTTDKDTTFSNSRVGVRYRVTEDDSPVAVAPFGGLTLVGTKDPFTDEGQLFGGCYAGAVVTGVPVEQLRLSAGGSLGTMVIDREVFPSMLLTGRASVLLTPKFSLDIEPGVQVWLGEGSEAYPAVNIGLSGDLSTRSSKE